jgi:hypothetical protein
LVLPHFVPILHCNCHTLSHFYHHEQFYQKTKHIRPEQERERGERGEEREEREERDSKGDRKKLLKLKEKRPLLNP